MADPHSPLSPIHPHQESSLQQLQQQERSPLLPIPKQSHPPFPQTQGQENQEEGGIQDDNVHSPFDMNLQRIDLFLALFGFHQHSIVSCGISWVIFLIIGVCLPLTIRLFFNCSDCGKYEIRTFELGVFFFRAALAAVSMLYLSHNLRKYGIRQFLFVDRYKGHVERFGDAYVSIILDSARLLVLWILPCLIIKTTHEIMRSIYVNKPWLQSIGIIIAEVVSWTYLTLIFLSACILFHLVCNLQVIHFDDYGKLLERESDVLKLLQEHILLRFYLSKISHRFRIYLVLVFLVVTASQVMTLFQTTGYGVTITFVNGGEFLVSSIVQVVGIYLCLHAAAKISHRAQAVASVASKWHAIATCSFGDVSQMTSSGSVGNLSRISDDGLPLRTSNSIGNMVASNFFEGMDLNSESDLESLDSVTLPFSRQMVSFMPSYHKRQALVTYLQNNPGGITIFGWTADRGLINTIFFIELSLVLFVLGKTIIN